MPVPGIGFKTVVVDGVETTVAVQLDANGNEIEMPSAPPEQQPAGLDQSAPPPPAL